MKLSPQAVYCLSEAINKLHEAARLVDRDTASELIVIADKIEVAKREGGEGMIVLINGVQYTHKVEVKPLDDATTIKVLEVLTEMRYFGQSHKMHSLAYDAIYAISPDLANMDPDDAFRFVRNDHQ